MIKQLYAFGVVLALFVALAVSATPAAPSASELKSPAGSSSGEPNLAVGPDGRVFMAWIEPGQGGKGNVLYFSSLQSDAWSAPKAIARGANWFVNPADFPSVAVMPDGTLAAHWLVLSGPEADEAYDVNLAFSKDGGTTWSKPIVPHRDHKKKQHGFVSLMPTSDGKVAAI